MSRKKVLVALSGGVDSSVCVDMMKKAGHDVTALVLDLSPAHGPTVAAAQLAAKELGIDLIVAKEEQWFWREVVSPWARAYRDGLTPNPCIFCNPTTKFAILQKAADEGGFDKIVTGHYADTEEKDGHFFLKKATFLPRDQSYMLYRLSQAQLSRLWLPLASLSKDEVRQMAKDAGLSCAGAPDSQEICFIPDDDYAGFITTHFGATPPGEFIAPDGSVCGVHKGILHYTVGQRKRLGISLGRPVCIKSIDPVTNRIYLAETDGLLSPAITLSGCHWIIPQPVGSEKTVGAKIRSVAKEAPATLTVLPDGGATVVFDTPQRAPAPGQSCVLYDGDYVIGGGYITA